MYEERGERLVESSKLRDLYRRGIIKKDPCLRSSMPAAETCYEDRILDSIARLLSSESPVSAVFQKQTVVENSLYVFFNNNNYNNELFEKSKTVLMSLINDSGVIKSIFSNDNTCLGSKLREIQPNDFLYRFFSCSIEYEITDLVWKFCNYWMSLNGAVKSYLSHILSDMQKLYSISASFKDAKKEVGELATTIKKYDQTITQKQHGINNLNEKLKSMSSQRLKCTDVNASSKIDYIIQKTTEQIAELEFEKNMANIRNVEFENLRNGFDLIRLQNEIIQLYIDYVDSIFKQSSQWACIDSEAAFMGNIEEFSEQLGIFCRPISDMIKMSYYFASNYDNWKGVEILVNVAISPDAEDISHSHAEIKGTSSLVAMEGAKGPSVDTISEFFKSLGIKDYIGVSMLCCAECFLSLSIGDVAFRGTHRVVFPKVGGFQDNSGGHAGIPVFLKLLNNGESKMQCFNSALQELLQSPSMDKYLLRDGYLSDDEDYASKDLQNFVKAKSGLTKIVLCSYKTSFYTTENEILESQMEFIMADELGVAISYIFGSIDVAGQSQEYEET